MNDKLFVIGIGGTGMRCLESFVHLCAMGMFDGQEIDILTIDTDTGNGNKDRTENLIALYNDIKSSASNQQGGVATKDSFFTAKLNLYKFATDYSGNRVSYRNLANISDDDHDNQDLADLFLDKETVQNFNLSHGYRAQTHLGSMLMYNGIVEAARNAYMKGEDKILPQEKALKEFVEKLLAAGAGARVFIFGSVFGGTGASSIPVVPRALNEAVRIISDGTNTLDPENVIFGASLLTDYFKFPAPDQAQKQTEKVVADSRNFALNSQAALDFYRQDPTVKTYYRRLYHIGWPQIMRHDITEGGKLLTGGGDQKNPCHVVELMSAMAAYDFFTQPKLEVNTNADNMPCFYRTVEQTDDGRFLNFSAESFYKPEGSVNPFMEKIAQMFSLSNLVLVSHGASHALNTSDKYYGLHGLIQRLKEGVKHEVPFVKIDPVHLGKVEAYLRQFAFRFADDNKGKFMPGWLYQIRYSVDGGRFIFRNDAFIGSNSQYQAMMMTPGSIFDGAASNKNWEGGDKQYNNFINSIKNNVTVNSGVGATTEMEQFLGFLYSGIRKAHKFSN
ncbi:MAG: hypothetical protein HDS88_01395 [Bacteroidales bacterium]|nr:hypothetical protein [Bacteroidales bacterium]